MKTTTQLAAIIGVTPGRIRQVARLHAIGTMITERTRIFSETEVKRMQRLMPVSKLGRPRKSKNDLVSG